MSLKLIATKEWRSMIDGYDIKMTKIVIGTDNYNKKCFEFIKYLH